MNPIEFVKFISKHINLKKYYRLACGGGANTIYLAEKFKSSIIIGIDINKSLLKLANQETNKKNIKNIKYLNGNWFDVNKKKNIDGVIAFQALSFVEGSLEKKISVFNKKNFNFLAFSTLCTPFDVNFNINVDDFSKGEFEKGTYDVYSFKILKQLLKKVIKDLF